MLTRWTRKNRLRHYTRRPHAPHQPNAEWIQKINAKHLFDDGWNKFA